MVAFFSAVAMTPLAITNKLNKNKNFSLFSIAFLLGKKTTTDFVDDSFVTNESRDFSRMGGQATDVAIVSCNNNVVIGDGGIQMQP